MSARIYGIDSLDGNSLTTGLQEHEVRASAQRLANHLGADVEVYSLDGADDDDGDWQPAESWTVSPDPLMIKATLAARSCSGRRS